MQTTKKHDMLKVHKGRIVCPVCGNRTRTQIGPDTKAERLPVWCVKCHWRADVNIDGFDQCYVI